MQQLTEGWKDGKVSHEILKKQLKLKLQQQHVSEWKADTGSKLNFSGEIKEKSTHLKSTWILLITDSIRQYYPNYIKN